MVLEPQVAKVVGPDITVALLRPVFLELLADSSSGVVGKVARSMDDWLLRFYQPDAEEAKQVRHGCPWWS